MLVVWDGAEDEETDGQVNNRNSCFDKTEKNIYNNTVEWREA